MAGKLSKADLEKVAALVASLSGGSSKAAAKAESVVATVTKPWKSSADGAPYSAEFRLSRDCKYESNTDMIRVDKRDKSGEWKFFKAMSREAFLICLELGAQATKAGKL